MVAEPKCAFHLKRPKPFDALPPGCQFEAEPGDLIEWDGKHWCKFHLPLKATDDYMMPKSSWLEGGWRDGFLTELFAFIDAHNGSRELDLSGVQVPDHADLGRFDNDNACFAGALFGEWCKFDGATFGNSCNFDRATFGEGSRFDGATFGDFCSFGGATFEDVCSFNDTIFWNYCSFDGATFGRWCQFNGAMFGEWCRFAAVQPTVECPGSDQFGAISFVGAEFASNVNFEGRKFTSTADFTDAVFGHVPNFHGCTFHSDVRFRGAEFRDTHSAGAAAAYRVLKQAMEGLRAHDEQAMFFALQQRSQRHQLARTDPVRWFSALYDLTTEYGQSLGRPLVALAMVIVGFASLYEMLSYLAGKPVPGDALSFAIEQIARPFGIWSPRYLDGNGVAIWTKYLLENGGVLFRLLATAESVAGLALVALFLLALRRQFKLD